MTAFTLTLKQFQGPFSLLEYLIRKAEIDILDVCLCDIIQQFRHYIEILTYIDCDCVGDFIAVAGWLLELKSSRALPQSVELEEEPEEPSSNLVEHLLNYKKFRDAASLLEERGRRWQQNYARLSNDCPRRTRDLAEEPILNVELWDLVSAFGRIMDTAKQQELPPNILNDDTPVYAHMQRIQQRLADNGSTSFSELFKPGMLKTTLVGIFLGVLELVRHYHVVVEQYHLFGEIWLRPGEDWVCELPENADITSDSITKELFD